MAKDYDYYSDIKNVYDAKVGWNQATTDEERQKWSSVADAARKRLYDYGYKDIADQISASGADATATRKILEAYAPPKTTTTATPTVKATTAPDSTTLTNNELITTNNNEVRNKTNQLWGTQTNDRNVMANKYDKLEETAYSNPFESDEGKSIIGAYDLKAMQGRENELASGSASNGGNIDSYAAANALRQQAALKSKGQLMALEAHNNKINNVKGILESLGVYQQNQDKGMQNTIALQSNEGQRLFENEETAKNNEVARLSEQANVTGDAPIEWIIKNDDVYRTYLNEDGTFKKEMENVDIQALINSAKASGDTDTAQKLAAVRARKMLGNYGTFGQYANQGDVSAIKTKQTEAGRQFDEQTKLAKETLTAEQNATNAGYQNEIDKINAEKEAEKEILKFTKELTDETTGYTLTDEDKNMAELVIKNINSNLKTHTSNPDGRDLISYKDGTVLLNLPTGHIPHWWATQVLKPIFQSNLNAKACYTIARELGFSEEDISNVAEAIK